MTPEYNRFHQISDIPLEALELRLMPQRERLAQHQLYPLLGDLRSIRLFMEIHVFAVWDFMSLLKALQNQLTCTRVPWVPVASASTARFINEIVWGEESDLDEVGNPKSHFEMYLAAMEQVGASTDSIRAFLQALQEGSGIEEALEIAKAPAAARAFVGHTFNLIQEGGTHQIASAFTFGREDLIPDMFFEFIAKAKLESETYYSKLDYYLKRHIEVDGDEHGPLALSMIRELCGLDPVKWKEASATAQGSLAARLKMWDAIAAQISA